jgi:hypothetical protein
MQTFRKLPMTKPNKNAPRGITSRLCHSRIAGTMFASRGRKQIGNTTVRVRSLRQKVPKGRQTVAHHGSGGTSCRPGEQAPAGATQGPTRTKFVVAATRRFSIGIRDVPPLSGLVPGARDIPTTSVVGYGLPSLRDLRGHTDQSELEAECAPV